MTMNDVSTANLSQTDELSANDLAAVSGGDGGLLEMLAAAVVTWAVGKVLDAAVDGLQNAGPAPATEHGSIYTAQPAGFVG
jgi:hypothetical protein